MAEALTIPYAEHEAVILDYAASEKEVRRLRREVSRLQREQTVDPDSDEGKEVKELLDLWWQEVMGSDPRVAHCLESTRAAKVKAALKRRRRIDKEDGFAICRRAVLGVREDDWAMGRVAKSGGKKFNDVAEHVLNTDGDIEKFARLYEQRGQRRYEENLKRLEREWQPVAHDPVTVILRALAAKGCEFHEFRKHNRPLSWKAQCPAHDDHNPSLSIDMHPDGDRLLVKCWAGCETVYVMDALGLSLADLFERRAA